MRYHGSSHDHSFLCVYNLQIFNADNISEDILFLDCIIKAALRDIAIDPDLLDLVVTCQIHSFPRSCPKFKKETFCYNCEMLFTERILYLIFSTGQLCCIIHCQ